MSKELIEQLRAWQSPSCPLIGKDTMPDFERLTRSLETDLACTPERKAYVQGMHAGMDKARWQIVRLCGGIALGVIIYQAAKHWLA